MRRDRLIVVTVLVLSAAVGAAAPALAPNVGQHPVNGRGASSVAVAAGQHPRLVLLHCLSPDRVGLDEPHLSACPQALTLRVSAGQIFPIGR
jgi:hypothetical protein